jgi:hypothetical protein
MEVAEIAVARVYRKAFVTSIAVKSPDLFKAKEIRLNDFTEFA